MSMLLLQMEKHELLILFLPHRRLLLHRLSAWLTGGTLSSAACFGDPVGEPSVDGGVTGEVAAQVGEGLDLRGSLSIHPYLWLM